MTPASPIPAGQPSRRRGSRYRLRAQRDVTVLRSGIPHTLPGHSGNLVHGGVAALTVVYESLTTLASGALLAGVVLGLEGLDQGDIGWQTWGLLALVGLPILPGVFNRLVDRNRDRRDRRDSRDSRDYYDRR